MDIRSKTVSPALRNMKLGYVCLLLVVVSRVNSQQECRQHYSSGSGPGKCCICSDSYVLDSDIRKCVKTCPNGTVKVPYPDDGTDTNCNGSEANETYAKNICCSPECESCSGGSKQCTTCTAGFFKQPIMSTTATTTNTSSPSTNTSSPSTNTSSPSTTANTVTMATATTATNDEMTSAAPAGRKKRDFSVDDMILNDGNDEAEADTEIGTSRVKRENVIGGFKCVPIDEETFCTIKLALGISVCIVLPIVTALIVVGLVVGSVVYCQKKRRRRHRPPAPPPGICELVPEPKRSKQNTYAASGPDPSAPSPSGAQDSGGPYGTVKFPWFFRSKDDKKKKGKNKSKDDPDYENIPNTTNSVPQANTPTTPSFLPSSSTQPSTHPNPSFNPSPSTHPSTHTNPSFNPSPSTGASAYQPEPESVITEELYYNEPAEGKEDYENKDVIEALKWKKQKEEAAAAAKPSRSQSLVPPRSAPNVHAQQMAQEVPPPSPRGHTLTPHHNYYNQSAATANAAVDSHSEPRLNRRH